MSLGFFSNRGVGKIILNRLFSDMNIFRSRFKKTWIDMDQRLELCILILYLLTIPIQRAD